MSAPVTHLLWLDTETTGLVPGESEVMQLGALVSDLAGKPLQGASIEVRQHLRYPERMHPLASKRHGVASGEEWNSRPDVARDAIACFRTWLESMCSGRLLLLAGWNPGFDERMLRQNPGHEGTAIDLIRFPGLDYHMLDLWTLAFTLLGPGASSLENCARILGLEAPPHTALADAELARQVLVAITGR